MNISIPTFVKISIPKVKIAAMMLMILALSIWFALHSQPAVRVVAPDLIIQPVTMRRESDASRSILVNLPNGKTLVWEVA